MASLVHNELRYWNVFLPYPLPPLVKKVLLWLAASVILWDNLPGSTFEKWYKKQVHLCFLKIIHRVNLFNSLRAKFFSKGINIYLQFLSFLHIDMTQVVGILPHLRLGHT